MHHKRCVFYFTCCCIIEYLSIEEQMLSHCEVIKQNVVLGTET